MFPLAGIGWRKSRPTSRMSWRGADRGASVNTLLRLTGITKAFAGVQALKGVSFDLQAGEVHALIGENGAGKSTLIKILTGAVQPDAGVILLDGQPVQDNSPHRSRQLGIAAVYQQPAIFPDLTVAENISLVNE